MYLHVIVYHHSLVSKPEEKEEKGRVFSHLSMCLTGIIEDEAVHLHTHTYNNISTTPFSPLREATWHTPRARSTSPTCKSMLLGVSLSEAYTMYYSQLKFLYIRPSVHPYVAVVGFVRIE